MPAPTYDDVRPRIARWVSEWGPHVLAVARAHCASEADAHDVVAESWKVVLTQWDRLPPEDQARGWIVGIAVNVARSRARTARRRERLMAENADLVTSRTGARQPDVEVRLLADATWKAIGGLPPLQRDVLLRRIFDGMSTKQVAQAIQRSEGTVKTSLFRALQRLRDELGKDLEDALASVSARTERSR